MTVSSLEPVNNYTGNNSVRTFDFDFLIENEKELKVSILNTDTNVVTDLVLGVDYSINEVGNKNGSFINFPLQSSSFDVLQENQIISLCLDLPIKQESEFENSSDLKLDILEWTFDYIVRILQIFNRKLDRTIKINEGSSFSGDSLVSSLFEAAESAQKCVELTSQNAQESFLNAKEAVGALKTVHNKANNNLDNLTEEGKNVIVENSASLLPVGTIISVNSSSYYVPNNALPCEGAEYSKVQFKDLWDNYLIGKDVFDPQSITVVGSPTITDDGMANFTDNNYIRVFTTFLENSTNYSINFSFHSTDILAQKSFVNNCLATELNSSLILHNGKFKLYLTDVSNSESYNIAKSVDGKTTLSPNVKYYVRISFNGEKYVVEQSTDKENWVEEIVVESTLKANWVNYLYLGNRGYWQVPVNETFDLKDFYIVSDWQTVFDCLKNQPLLNTCSYEDYEQDLATNAICNKFAIKSVEYNPISVSVVGSPTITDEGILSNCSANNYIQTPSITIENPDWEINFVVDTTGINGNVGVLSIPNIGFIYTGVNTLTKLLSFYIVQSWDGGGAVSLNSLPLNKKYQVIWGMKGTTHYSKIREVGAIEWLVEATKTYETVKTTTSPINIGYDATNKLYLTNGSIDLKDFSVIIDGQTVFDCVNGGTFKVPTIKNDNENLKDFVVVSNGKLEDSQIDWNEWASSLQGKANNDLSNCSKPYVVETSDKSIFPSWYRIYSDGWCEQGGITTGGTTSTGKQVSLLKDLRDNYSLRVYVLGNSDSFNTAGTWVKTRAITNSSFYIATGFTGASTAEYAVYNCSWEAKGYLQ